MRSLWREQQRGQHHPSGKYRARRGCLAGTPKLLVLIPLGGLVLCWFILSRFAWSHRRFSRASPWKAVEVVAPRTEVDQEKLPQLAEFGRPSDLHRAAAAACISVPSCRVGVVLASSSEAREGDAEEAVSLRVSYAGRDVPVVLLNLADTWAYSAAPRKVTCPAPDGAVWLVMGRVRWKLPDSGVAAACSPAAPAWVSCDWLHRLPKGPDIASASECSFGRGSVVAVTRRLDRGLFPLLHAGAYVLLSGPAPEPGITRMARLAEAQRIEKIPSPGAGLQHSVGVWVHADAGLPLLDGAKVAAIFSALREAPAFSAPITLDPLLQFTPCGEWPAKGSDTPCGPRPFSVFDHLLGVRAALLLAHQHRFRAVLPSMAPVDEEEGGGGTAHHDHGSGAGGAVPAHAILSTGGVALGLRGTVDVVDSSHSSAAKLGWSLFHEGLGPEGTYAESGGDWSGASEVLHLTLKKYAGQAGKLEVEPCPLGLVKWQFDKVYWHAPLWRRITSSLVPPPRISALRDSFRRELSRQAGKPGYNALDLRDFHVLQERCKCLLRAGDSRLAAASLDCGISTRELVEKLTTRLGFDASLPLVVAVDDITAEELLPELSAAFRLVVRVGEVVAASPPLSSEEALLLEAAVAEEATVFAGQMLSALSFHVKERRAAAGAAAASSAAVGSLLGLASAEGGVMQQQGAAAAAGGSSGLRRGAGGMPRAGKLAAVVHRVAAPGEGVWRPVGAYYFDRADVHSCASLPLPAPPSSAPCPEEAALWLSL